MDDESVKIVTDFDLASEATIIFALVCSVEHAVFHVIHRWQLVEPRLVYVAVTGSAGAGATALGDDTVNIVIDRAFHYRVAVIDIDFVTSSSGRYVSDFGH